MVQMEIAILASILFNGIRLNLILYFFLLQIEIYSFYCKSTAKRFSHILTTKMNIKNWKLIVIIHYDDNQNILVLFLFNTASILHDFTFEHFFVSITSFKYLVGKFLRPVSLEQNVNRSIALIRIY